ncbi:MAG: non-hydrolyzing UDP-N-acetylglucosamine 2-epimerase [Acidimicrobiales bacterium]
MTVVGTRPEIIRLSRVILRLDQLVDHTVVHTGQNWDRQLSDVFFDELALRPPDVRLAVDTSSLGTVIGGILAAIEPVLRDIRPDAFLVLGDTNSCLAAVMAKRLGVPVFHMEAGNRCFDENVPEEVNRRLIDHIADFNLCYTENARSNLLGEGLHPQRVFVTGSPMAEVLNAYRSEIAARPVLERMGVEPGGYLLASMHREENVDNPDNLAKLLSALRRLQKGLDVRVLVTTHPRLRDRLPRLAPDADTSTIDFCDPFGYLDYIRLQQHARCVVSDSGTISEESAILGFPAVTIRNAMERPEALDAGSMILTGVEPEAVERAVELVVSDWDAGRRPSVPPAYQVADCSARVVRLIVGLSGVHRRWANLDPKLGWIGGIDPP